MSEITHRRTYGQTKITRKNRWLSFSIMEIIPISWQIRKAACSWRRRIARPVRVIGLRKLTQKAGDITPSNLWSINDTLQQNVVTTNSFSASMTPPLFRSRTNEATCSSSPSSSEIKIYLLRSTCRPLDQGVIGATSIKNCTSIQLESLGKVILIFNLK